MELTVIGHWGGFPKVGEASTGYLLEHEGFKLLIDCGSAVLSQLQYYVKPTELHAVILSHYHPDHVADIGVLQHALLIGKYTEGFSGNLPIYGHQEDQAGFAALTYKNVTTGISYKGDESIHIGPFQIEFIKTLHPVPCYAMRLTAGGRTLVYTADTAYFSDLVAFAREADLLLCESNYYKDMKKSAVNHMTSDQAGQLAKAANIKNLVLTHLPHFGDHEQLVSEAKEEYAGEITLALSGLKITI
ncbi:MBL fold metallo-hydrolase [Lederbergia sp. NSJ-179]|uniref:MBL fold metallo-hydrolase n=1 Tax=Lederbergia sp. NSJ-179 TaxID=2931402 RepID=UPI001FD0FBE0|nr:MBL fold metallo-hydrolase [Lederbergia sp. NSJ-179]MCJ7840401.1 MBL fold metallo-hydrolase [Lederbergia sp. NSJ-179]